MTESKAHIFNIFFADIDAAHDFDVRLLRNAFLAVTEPEFDQSLRYQFGFEMCATEPPHGVPCLTLAFNTFNPAPAIRIAPAFSRSQPSRFQNRMEPIAVDVPLL